MHRQRLKAPFIIQRYIVGDVLTPMVYAWQMKITVSVYEVECIDTISNVIM
jgi:hypothetical protein